MPAPSHSGGCPRCERQIMEAIVHVACTGQAWTRLPSALGPFQACRSRLSAVARRRRAGQGLL
ncbi:transposase [Streptomyces sp. NPDC007126]|uniref:transposase n=1 Tax=Streptomyces sp. NPDC007126 TaxID=3364774 RepID=UPI003691AD9B